MPKRTGSVRWNTSTASPCWFPNGPLPIIHNPDYPHTHRRNFMSKYLLTVDLGTSGPKVGLFSDKGKYIAHEIEPNDVLLLPNGGAEQDPEQWLLSIKTALGRLLAKTGINPRQVQA